MTDPSEGSAVRFAIVESDRFEADQEQAILSVYRAIGPERANDWAKGLSRVISGLTSFPGPRSHAQDEAASAHFEQEVRRVLYYGPKRQRSGMPYRLLFSILPPDPEEPPETAETVLYLLRLLCGSQALQPGEPAE